jgi:peptide/nickel transport system substrate-binding protein
VRTAQTLVIRMRTDVEPWSDPRVRQALKLCQDRQKMLDLAFFGEGDLALDAHVAPVHPAYCERPIPKYDPQQARALLAEAGHPDGLKVTLTIKTDDGEEDLARVLKSLAAPGGFEITINIVKPEEYWNQWTEVDFGITIWYHRPLDTMTLALAYTVDGEQKPVAWNETRWVDDEFNQLLRTAERTLDVAARREIMCQLEDIMQSRGPIGISFWRKNWNITRTEFKNVRAHPTGYDLFYDVWKDA